MPALWEGVSALPSASLYAQLKDIPVFSDEGAGVLFCIDCVSVVETGTSSLATSDTDSGLASLLEVVIGSVSVAGNAVLVSDVDLPSSSETSVVVLVFGAAGSPVSVA